MTYRVDCMEETPDAYARGLCMCGCALPVGKNGKRNPNRTWCSKGCVDRVLGNHEWGHARAAALERVGRNRDGWACEMCGVKTLWPEVNHKEPLRGGVRQKTCLNHQDNLEVLCHSCHLGVTAEQRKVQPPRRSRAAKRMAQGVLL